MQQRHSNSSIEHPKVELHCHLLGVLSPSLLAEVSKSQAVLVAEKDLAKVLPITRKEGFQRAIDVLAPYQGATWQEYCPILSFHIAALIRQNVVYTEIMISPLMFPQQRDEMMAAFRQFRRWVDSLEQGRLQVEFLMVLPRTLPSDKVEKNTLDYLQLYAAGLIAGVAVVGLENGGSIRHLSATLTQFKNVGLGIEIHAGEHSGPEDVWEALEFGLADRIGHGIGAFQDDVLIDHLQDQRIHLEFCLTSNLCTGSIQGWEEHPILLALERGISFSLNTDDPGLFACSLTDEFELAIKHYGFSDEDFSTIYSHALEARFQPRLKYLR